MNCDDVQNGIYVFLDGEFAAPEEADFQAHIDRCGDCRSVVVREARFLMMVRDHTETPDLPLGLETRIVASLAEAGAPGEGQAGLGRTFRPWWRNPWVGAPAGAMVAALLLVWPLSPASSESDLGPAAHHAVNTHHSQLPSDIRGNEQEVKTYLANTVGFAASLPLRPDKVLRLVGARLTQMDGRPAVVYQYRLGDQPISVLQVPQVRALPGVLRKVRHLRGYGVVSFDVRGVRHAVVGAVSDAQLIELIPARVQGSGASIR